MTKQYITKSRFDTVYYKDEARTILHREDGPAIEWNDGNLEWFLNGKRHRIDGPAFEYVDGTKYWYINDVLIFAVDGNNKLSRKMK
jgi:hypothetical protein